MSNFIEEKGDESTNVIDKSFALDETGISNKFDQDGEANANEQLDRALSDLAYSYGKIS